MMTNTGNVESSLQLLFIIRNLVYVQFLLQVAHVELSWSRVVSSMKSPVVAGADPGFDQGGGPRS